MNDRHLYKAKRKDNGEWVAGCLLIDYITGQYFIHACGNSLNESDKIGEEGCLRFVAFEVDPSTLCQCTGISDKNGKLIWENDIVYARCNGLSGYGVIKYDKGCFVLIDKKRNRNYSLFGEWKFRVDGNVFDNPELLEKENLWRD